jgi:hypothetical protein
MMGAGRRSSAAGGSAAHASTRRTSRTVSTDPDVSLRVAYETGFGLLLVCSRFTISLRGHIAMSNARKLDHDESFAYMTEMTLLTSSFLASQVLENLKESDATLKMLVARMPLGMFLQVKGLSDVLTIPSLRAWLTNRANTTKRDAFGIITKIIGRKENGNLSVALCGPGGMAPAESTSMTDPILLADATVDDEDKRARNMRWLQRPTPSVAPAAHAPARNTTARRLYDLDAPSASSIGGAPTSPSDDPRSAEPRSSSRRRGAGRSRAEIARERDEARGERDSATRAAETAENDATHARATRSAAEAHAVAAEARADADKARADAAEARADADKARADAADARAVSGERLERAYTREFSRWQRRDVVQRALSKGHGFGNTAPFVLRAVFNEHTGDF